MNYKYLNPKTITGHAATLVVVLAQLLSKESLCVNQERAIFMISLALPAMVLAYVMWPEGPIPDKTSNKIYMVVHPIAHVFGILALVFMFNSLSKYAGTAFGISAIICLLVVLIKQILYFREPAVKEAFETVKKHKARTKHSK